MKPKICSSSIYFGSLVQLVAVIFLALVENVNCALSSDASSGVRECGWLYKENPEDCRSYFQCLHGKPVLQRCPRQLHWNSEGMYCDWQYRSQCKAGKKKIAGPKPDSMPKGNSLFGHFTDFLLGQYGTGSWKDKCVPNSYEKDPNDCSAYFVCNGSGEKISQQCPPGLLFNPGHSGCDWSWNVVCSSTSGSGSEIESVTEEPQPLPPVPTTGLTTTTTESPAWSTSSTLPPFIPESTTSQVTTTTTRPPTTTNPEVTGKPVTTYPILIPSSDFKIVCYFTGWAVYRPDGGKFFPSDIDPSKCTHINYAFAIMSATTYELQMGDEWIDGPDGKDFYGQVTALKELGIKVLISVGGWNDSGDIKWSKMLKDPSKMQTFILSVKAFLKLHGFDGIDLDYEYPACPQGNCAANTEFEKNAFTVLVRGLRETLGEEAIITAAVSCNEHIIKQAYDVSTLSVYLDFFNLMAYDFHGAWEKFTALHAPIYAHPRDEPYLSTHHAIKTYIALKAPPEKLCVGMPAYGQTYTLSNVREYSVGARVEGPGIAGQYTRQKGLWAFHEICRSKNWTHTVTDPEDRFGPFSVNQDERLWVSYDDPYMFNKKGQLILDLELGGAMVWALDLDDYDNRCGLGRYPLLSAIQTQLRGPRAAEISRRRRQRKQMLKKKQKKSQGKRRRSRRRRV